MALTAALWEKRGAYALFNFRDVVAPVTEPMAAAAGASNNACQSVRGRATLRVDALDGGRPVRGCGPHSERSGALGHDRARDRAGRVRSRENRPSVAQTRVGLTSPA